MFAPLTLSLALLATILLGSLLGSCLAYVLG